MIDDKSYSTLGERAAFIDHLTDNIQNSKTANSRNNRLSYEAMIRDLDSINAWLKTTYQLFKNANKPNASISYASEWVLDNYYIIKRNVRQIKKDLSAGFYNNLPKLVGGDMDGCPRVFVVVANALAHQDLLFESTDFEQIIIELQKKIPLQTSE
ncbi:MAG TPA: hypothetical protein VFC68_04515, partial [Treponemataceae bacterium]|nr:hypothetical protein [Treponemataceae bacterium]